MSGQRIVSAEPTGRGSDDRAERQTVTGRRRYLRMVGGLVGAVLTAGCSGGTVGVPWFGASSLATVASGGRRTAIDPADLTAEPMGTRVRTVDGTNVLYQYGRPVPSFDTWNGNAGTRDHVSLDGEWRFRFDDADEGVDEGWYTAGYDDADWDRVAVPLPWDLHDTPHFGSYDGSHYGEGTAFRDGYAWYRTTFDADGSWRDRLVRLHFLGASYMAWVFVNGELVGQHEGGHTPFALDVGDSLRPGVENVVAVRVYRRPWWDDETAEEPTPVTAVTQVPSKPVDFWPYAGLTRSVYLEVTPRVTVSKLLTDARDGSLTVHAVVENRTDERVHRWLTVDPGDDTGGVRTAKKVVLRPGEVRVPTVHVPIPDATPWTPDAPATYRATAALSGGGEEGDELSTRYGMRTVGTADGRVTVNGEPVFLKGVNWHEETPERGRSLTPADYDAELAHLDALGANLLRNSHYNRHPYLYDAADEAGVLLLDEAENMWLDEEQQRVQFRSYGLSRALVAAMVWNQHNHPSVALWSLQNESRTTSGVYESWLADMRDAVRALDCQERPVTWASHTPIDPAFHLADVIGLNEYFGYFYGSDDMLGSVLDGLHERHPDTPILITENGTWSAPELRGGRPNPLTDAGTPEWQAAKFRSHWRQVTHPDRAPYMAGFTFWSLRDYKTRESYNRFSYNGLSTMGLLPFGSDAETPVYAAFRDARPPNWRT